MAKHNKRNLLLNDEVYKYTIGTGVIYIWDPKGYMHRFMKPEGREEAIKPSDIRWIIENQILQDGFESFIRIDSYPG